MTDPSPREALPAPASQQPRICVAAGTSTAYWEYGSPDLPVLVAVHGLRGTHHGLVPVVSRLHRYRAVVPDLPGFGESARLAGARHDVTGYTGWLRRFLRALGHTDVVLLGHSFGSVLAAAAVVDGAPVRALVLLNPITEPSGHPARRAATRMAVTAHRMTARLPARMGSALLHNEVITRCTGRSMMTTRDRPLRRWIHAEHRRHFGSFADPVVLSEAFETATREHVGSYAGGVAVPTLLLAGEHDVLAPLPDQQALLGGFADARLEVLHDIGHLSHYEAPTTVARAVDATADAVTP